MTEIIRLPDNIIGKEDRERLESFAGHTIARGRATRWHWGKNAAGDDVFEIYTGGAHEVLAVDISRDRRRDEYQARDVAGHPVARGMLEHVFAELEAYFIRLHGEQPDTPA
ncbi:MAG TPA: hypothetical protein VET88_00555 [Gammaproteobacteria bacterium]|nr:hypothetical protein [Gammaproteobacteria bacterium]